MVIPTQVKSKRKEHDATITGQKLTLTITPVADAPTNMGGVSDSATLDNIQPGHKAAITVTLSGDFADVDGSEAHFLIVSAPQGVTVLKGAGYTVTSLTAAELAALNAADPAFAASGTVYKIVLPNSTTASVSLPVNLEITTTVYNGGELLLAGAASEVLANGTRDYGISIAPSVTLPPAVTPDFGNSDPAPVAGAATVDSLRGTSASGSLNMKVDPDGDTVTVSGVSFGGVEGAPGTVDGKPCHSVQGQYGTLHVFADGTYRYDLDASSYNTAAQEVFDYQLTDAYGGTGQSTITINLTTPNNAPTATPVSARLDSVRQNVVEGNLVLRDKDNDAVEVSGVNGSTTLVNLGTDDAPLWGFAAAGEYGTIQVFEQNGQWKYRYLLDEEHRGEVRDESFSFTVRDAHGMENTSSIAVDLYNVNTNPVAGKGSATLDTLRDADDAVSGQVALKDKEGDTVSLNAATGPDGAAGAWGTDDRGDTAFVVRGEHGVLYLYQSTGTAIQYRYVLTDQSAGGLNATETFTYHVDDGYLGTASNTISIDLTNTNNQPVISGTLSVELDTLRTTTGEATGSLTFSDPDYNPDAGRHDVVTLSGVSFNGAAGVADGQGGFTVNGAYGVFHIDANGAYTYTLNADAAGETGREAFTVTITDEFGATRQEDVSIDLVLHNQNPQASNGVLKLDTWRDGGRASGSVTLHDADGDTVRVDSVTGSQPGTWGVDDEGTRSLVVRGDHGTLYLHEDGTYRYLLDADAAGQSGQDVFTYTVQDGFRGTDAGTITINLDNANTAPVLSGDLSASIGGNIDKYEGGLVREEGQLAWNDMEGDAIASVSIGGVALPASGEVSIVGQYGTLHVTMQTGGASYVYVLNDGLDNQGIRDVDSFDIVVTDEFGGTSSQSLEVNLSPLSHSPECDDVNVNWPTDSNGDPLSFAIGSLSFRDADLDYDPTESLTLMVNNTVIGGEGKIDVDGLYGTLTIKADGSFSYTVKDYLGQDLLEDFTYTVTDKAGNSVSAHLYIRLSDNAPVFPNTGTTEAGIVPKGAEIDLAIFEDFSFLESSAPSDTNASDASEPAPAAAEPQESGHAEPAPVEPVEVDLVNVPMPYDMDATQSIA